ncbi:uncharacterized protein LOC136088022 [Hydra vulgaris]|uniref:Uncharacterized protein LOC136088022 n=1 Tax=Hydra vulgaris TaxID=6087 RepID=A0ABM4D0H5_HYDVU
MDLWVKNGWLKPCNKEEKSTKGIVSLMAVEQENKGKIRPVMDFCELNQYVNSHNASSDACISEANDHYIDDIVVNLEKTSVEKVVNHLACYGLVTKEPVQCETARVLGCYPVEEWLRIAWSFIKRHIQGNTWDDLIGDQAQSWLIEILRQLEVCDSVRGKWKAKGIQNRATLWCDANSMVIGVAIEYDGVIIEDAAWLQSINDVMHINITKLDAVVCGINLAAKWDTKSLSVFTDSVKVHGWLKSMLTESHRIRSNPLSEMLIKRRLSLLQDLIKEYNINITLKWVPSSKNKADVLTRVPKTWLNELSRRSTKELCGVSIAEEIRNCHSKHHFGVNRTMFTVQQRLLHVLRKDAEECVRKCCQCNSIHPAPIKWGNGALDVPDTWYRIACDVTHYKGSPYLTKIDCGPSRFAIWRKLPREDTKNVVSQLEPVFREHGPPQELLMDNGAVFKSSEFSNICEKWCVKKKYRCAYRPSGNGIVERNHCTVKRTAARTQICPLVAVFWYNTTPTVGTNEESAPASQKNKYVWRLAIQEEKNTETQERSRQVTKTYRIGEKVYVRPADAKHVRDVRIAPASNSSNASSKIVISEEVDSDESDLEDLDIFAAREEGTEETVVDAEQEADGREIVDNLLPAIRQSTRERRKPTYLNDYVTMVVEHN